jgi:4-aminobutyrate aminotransferase
LAAGMPLSAVTGRADIMDAPAPGGLGGTYAGNPMAIAAAHAVIDVMRDERLPERGEQLGQQLKAVLEAMRPTVPHIFDIRGLGAMVAVEFNAPGTDAPDANFTKRVQAEALKRNLILLTCGVNANVIRFLFPLTVAQAHFDEAMVILKDALQAAVPASVLTP